MKRIQRKSWFICFTAGCILISLVAEEPTVARNVAPGLYAGLEENQTGLYPNTPSKDMNADMPWRVESADTDIPVIWIIKDSNQWAVDEMKYVVLYDVSDGHDPPGDWDNPFTDHVVYYHDFNDMEIDQDYWYWLSTVFENDGGFHGSQPDGTPLTPANLGYSPGDTISFTLRLYGKDGFWPFITDVKLDQDFKVHVGGDPLPVFDDWYLGDIHNHGWKTDNPYEYAEPTEGKALAAKAIGLSWVTITDHASDLTTQKWNDLGIECATYSSPDILMIRSEEAHANAGGLEVRHLVVHDIDTYLEGGWVGTYSINELLGGPEPANNLTAQDGFAFAAHPTADGFEWSYGELTDALNYPVFAGLQFHNERAAYFSSVDGSEDEDEYHPWGGDIDIDPYNHDWVLENANYNDDVIAGMQSWDELMSERMNPVRKIFIAGGSDAHGAWNYGVNLELTLSEKALSSAMGKMRMAVFCPDEFTQESVLSQIKSGHSVVTDGPMALFGVDMDADGSLAGDSDIIIGDGPMPVVENDPTARLLVKWKSTTEIGDLVCLRLFRGTGTTAQNPAVVWELFPMNYEGMDNTLLMADILPPAGETAYFRLQAYTFDPDGPVPSPGDVSNVSYDPVSQDYYYCAYTNPIWVSVLSQPTATPTPTVTETPVFTVTATPTFTNPTSIPSVTPTAGGMTTATPTTPPSIPAAQPAGLIILLCGLSVALILGYRKQIRS
jgi:hypothetical protein